jgi:hypothetical protein
LEKLPEKNEMTFELLQTDPDIKKFLSMRLDILLRCKPAMDLGDCASTNKTLISRLVNSEINLIKKFKQILIES